MAKAAHDRTTSTPTVTVELDPNAWECGPADAVARAPWRCPAGLDRLSYASGYTEGRGR